MRLTKAERDALKAKGEWNYTPYTKELTGVEAFVLGAAKANPVPVPNPDVPLPEIVFSVFTPDPGSLSEVFSEMLTIPEIDEDIKRVYPILDDSVDHMGSFGEAYLIGCALRALETSNFEDHGGNSLPDVFVPGSVIDFFKMMGCFKGVNGTVGYSDAAAVAKSMLWNSQLCFDEVSTYHAISRLWLPSTWDDGHTDHILSVALSDLFVRYGVDVGPSVFKGHIFNGTEPGGLATYAEWLPTAFKEPLPLLFRSYKDAPLFLRYIGSEKVACLLSAMGLEWKSPSLDHLCFDYSLSQLIKDVNLGQLGKKKDPHGIGASVRKETNRRLGSPRQMCFINRDDLDSVWVPLGFANVDNIALAVTSRYGCYFSYHRRKRYVFSADMSVFDSRLLDWEV
jgi:hypothetical protein